MIAYLFVPHRDVDILSSVVHNYDKMKKLPLINLILLIGIIVYLLISNKNKQEYKENEIIPEIITERLNIVGKDGNKFVVLSNREKQALATVNGKPVNPQETERNIAGLLFFN